MTEHEMAERIFIKKVSKMPGESGYTMRHQYVGTIASYIAHAQLAAKMFSEATEPKGVSLKEPTDSQRNIIREEAPDADSA